MHWKWSGNKTIKLAWHLVPHIPPPHQGGLHITDTVDFEAAKRFDRSSLVSCNRCFDVYIDIDYFEPV